jgi:hypothetical protein
MNAFEKPLFVSPVSPVPQLLSLKTTPTQNQNHPMALPSIINAILAMSMTKPQTKQ